MTDEPAHGPYVSVVEEFDISEGGVTATVRKLKTRKGERLEIESRQGERTLRVDALGLESLAWQDPDDLSNFVPSGHEWVPLDEDAGDVSVVVDFKLLNEYAHVRIRRLQSPGRSVLQVHAPKKREQIQLDAVALDGLANQDHQLFTEFLEQPHGPEDDH